MDGQAAIDLERPRSIPQLIGASFDLYFRVPILFVLLAAVVVVPWELVRLLITGAGPLGRVHESFLEGQLLTLPDYFLITPLVSALHVHAVREVGEGRRPGFVSTFRRSLPALPVVALATGVTWLGVTVGLFALVVPGFILLARWAVVSQSAALDGGSWTDAIRRSTDLTSGHRSHAFWTLIAGWAVLGVPWFFLWKAVSHDTTTVASFVGGTAVEVVMRSFEAVVGAVLYFDLKGRAAVVPQSRTPLKVTANDRPTGWYVDPSQPTRMRYWSGDGTWSAHTAKTPKAMLREWEEQGGAGPQVPEVAKDEHTGHSLDPGVYSDEGRPPGWYVDPDKPWRMRYWRTGEHEGWSKETTKTPKKALDGWRDLRWRR